MAPFAVVTGGNRGLGLEVCKKLIKLNKPVIVTARNAESGQAAVTSLGSTARFYQLDTSSSESIKGFAEALRRDLPGQEIDLLINNAGIMEKVWSKENFDRTMTTNVSGPVELVRALREQLKEGALVINVSSTLGNKIYLKDEEYLRSIHACKSVDEVVTALKYKEDSVQKDEIYSSYSVSKAALSKATTLMSQEPALKEKHISLVSVCPGWCRTDMGTSDASRSSEEGADSILWPFTHFTAELNGGYVDKDGQQFEDK
ncbi:MAG: hypothetical protein WDW38_001645 [Sanguina aurantia]